MFGKRKTAVEEPEPPQRVCVDLEAEALARAQKAEARIVEADRALRAFNARHFLSGDWGLVVISGWTREAIDREGHALLREHDAAMTEFSAALAAWAEQKKK